MAMIAMPNDSPIELTSPSLSMTEPTPNRTSTAVPIASADSFWTRVGEVASMAAGLPFGDVVQT